MNKKYIYLLLICSGLALAMPWYESFSGIILFIAFIPLLFVEQYIYENQDKYKASFIFKSSLVTFIVWNITTTWWITNAAFIGIVAATVSNSLLMSTTVWLFHITKRRFGASTGYFSLIFFWIGFEYFYHNSEISWTWLTLGNGFAGNIKLVQWYEYTGVLGGSLWVLIINLILFFLIRNYLAHKKRKVSIYLACVSLFLILVPIIWSITKFNNYEEKNNPCNIVVIQPNIDPYNEKFSGMSNLEQLQILMDLAEENKDSTTEYVVGPETALDNNFWESTMHQTYSMKKIQQFIKNNPNIKFVSGISSYKKYLEGEKHSPTIREIKGRNIFYDSYNTAIQIDTTPEIQIYHKSKLVIGVEMMPYPEIFKFVRKWAIDLGGMIGGLGTQEEREVFTSPDGHIKVAPVICYESVYGEYVTEYIHKGANLIFVVTNDGWWGNTPGYKQHLSYSQLRAIETRRSIARSANTGISCFINQKGEIIQPTSWWERTAIKGKVNINNKITFYSKHGDYLGRIAQLFSIFIILSILAHFLINRSSIKLK